MPTWLAVLLVVVALFVVRGCVFGYLLWRASRLLSLVQRYWKKELTWEAAGERKREIVRLFRVAQLTEPGVDLYSPAPGGRVVHRQASVFDNLYLRRGDVQQIVFDCFVEAKGYFRDEIRRSLVPVFWPSVLMNLPADVLVYLGVKPTATVVRVSKVVAALIELVLAIGALIAFVDR